LTYFSINTTRKVKIPTVKHSTHYLGIKNIEDFDGSNVYGNNYST
jgi:hypothetical protein